MDTRIKGRREFLKTLGLGFGALAFSGFKENFHSKKKPNFVFILIDDLGWRDLACYGSLFYETPHIDRLAREGMSFSNAYAACTVCSPTRASILTGKYPARLHLTDWLPGRKDHPFQKLLHPKIKQQLPLEEITIAEILRSAGYRTASIGKWHLGHEEYHPEHHGFDINIGGYYRGQAMSHFSPYQNPTLKDGPEGEYLTDRLTDEALKYIEENRDKPFFLYLSHYIVHDPLQAKKEHIEKYEAKVEKMPLPKIPEFILEGNPDVPPDEYIGPEDRLKLLKEPEYNGFLSLPNRMVKVKQIQDNPIYAGMVESMDESVGRVMAKLRELGLEENTIVIFTSENGGLSSQYGEEATSNLPLRAGKGWLYEGGIRVPMIINWPGVVKPGNVCSEVVTSTDFYPTMLEMAGLPLLPKLHQDGLSLVTLLKQKGKLQRKAVYWHWPHYSNHGQQSPGGAVRSGDYKLIEYYENFHIELFNLKEGIGEQHNLAPEIPKKAEELRKMLHDWRGSVKAQMPTLNPDYEPQKQK